MKFSEAILLSLSVVFFIIGIHQTFILGITQSYWLFMLTVVMLLLNRWNKQKQEGKTEQAAKSQSAKPMKKTIATNKVKPRK